MGFALRVSYLCLINRFININQYFLGLQSLNAVNLSIQPASRGQPGKQGEVWFGLDVINFIGDKTEIASANTGYTLRLT